MKRLLTGILLALPSFAGDPWRTPLLEWTQQDATRILNDSPWAKRNGRTKTIVRWQSARPVRLAMKKLHAGEVTGNDDCYVIAIVGLTASEQAPKTAYLKPTGRAPIPSVETRLVDNAVLFFFPAKNRSSRLCFASHSASR